ncbi:MAG: cytochrome c [Bacteroidota bacterium]
MKGTNIYTTIRLTLVCSVAAMGLTGCWTDKSKRNFEYAPNMFYSIPLEPYSQTVSEENPDALVKYSPEGQPQDAPQGLSSFLPPEGTIPRGESWYRGEEYEPYALPNTPDGYELSATSVFSPLIDPDTARGFNCDETTYARGKQLYTIMCAICHGENGDGKGYLPTSGKFAVVPSYKSATGVGLKNLSEGKMYHSITYGKGVMGSYASQLTPQERWMVICYVQEFQKQSE